MDINRLRYFCAIAQSGSLTEASRLLGISQPALSKAMKLLEQELETELLRPQGRGLILTEAGRSIARRSAVLLQDLQSLKDRPATSSENKISIASFEVFTTYFLGRVAAENLAGQSLDIHELLPGEMEKAVAQNQVDFAITYLPIPHQDLEFIEVGVVTMGIFSRAGAFKNCPFAQLPFAIPIHPLQGVPTKSEGLDGWPDNRFARLVRYRVGMMESALELCRRGLAAAYLPRFVIDLHNRNVRKENALAELPLPEKMKRQKQPVFLVKCKTAPESTALRQVAKALRHLE